MCVMHGNLCEHLAANSLSSFYCPIFFLLHSGRARAYRSFTFVFMNKMYEELKIVGNVNKTGSNPAVDSDFNLTGGQL